MYLYEYIYIYVYIHLHTYLDCEGHIDPCYPMYHDQEDQLDDNGILPFLSDQWFIQPNNEDGTFLGNIHIYVYIYTFTHVYLFICIHMYI
jgi:hypothetical protein